MPVRQPISVSLTGLATVLLTAAWALAQDDEPPLDESGGAARVAEYEAEVRPLLASYCFQCHGEEKQKADVRLDTLDPDLVAGDDAEGWRAALDMINSGEMPPRRADQPSDDERRKVVTWMTEALDEAAELRRGEARVVLRRLNKAQYTNSLQDLLGLSVDFGSVLPDDGKSEMGFSNNGEVLQSSPLHLDYYRSIARQALREAIALGDKPEVTHYRITFGRNRGKDLVAAKTGGYQSVPLSPDDFVVDILDANGEPRVGADEQEQAELDDLKRRITIGLRGSSQSRFRVVDEGLVLYSAVPHKETAPRSWQGPSPNMKLEMQRCFPETGDFVMRVRASRGGLFPSEQEMLLEMEAPEPAVDAVNKSSGVTTREGAIVLSAFESSARENLVIDGAMLIPEDRPAPSSAAFDLKIARKGYYQVDLVHPPLPEDAMPSVRLGLGDLTLDMRPALSEEELKRTRVVTTIGAAQLRAKQHKLSVGGPFFVGFSHLVLTPIAEDHPLMDRLRVENDAATRSVQEAKTPWMRAFVGTRTDDGMDYRNFGERHAVTADAGSAETYSFFGRLENLPIPEPDTGDLEILSGFMLLGLWNDHLVKDPGESGPPLLVEAIEFEAPYITAWPPESHARIFFDSPLQGDEPAYASAVIERFAERAFRRPLQPGELDRYMAFWSEVADDYEQFEQGVQEVLVAILCSPHFLYLVEPLHDDAVADAEPGAISEYELATRLAYFLWNSPPDGELLELARSGALTGALAAQVDRMVEDPRAWRFIREFGREWLRVDRHESMTVHPGLYPDLTRFVKEDMAEETYHFLHEVLREDMSLFTLIDSDFAMLNQNLAEFYGIEGVEGPEFRPVPVAADLQRGGLLSQGAFLSGHSDGSQAHAIKRAVWVKKQILGDPPPEPPPNVPDLDPEAPGFENLTLKEQLELHRSKPSCMDCHRGIDPYGVVFESYDAAGRFQLERDGEPIDTTTVLADGTEIAGVEGIKEHILTRERDAFAESVIEHMFAYALGRDVSFADEGELAAILEHVKSSEYAMRSVIRGIVASPSFTRH